MLSANLTTFLTNKDFNLISDPEGYSLSHLLNKPEQLATPEKPLIVLGDLLDSTIAVTASGNILTMGDLKKLKSHNLDNLKQIRDNENIHLMFGNRDLNKLKILPLTKFKSVKKPRTTFTPFVKEFDEYMNPKSGTSYYDLAKILSNNIKNKIWEWEIPDLKHWIPFWKTYDPTKPNDDIYKLWKEGAYSKERPMSCLDRFFIIFGADNANGTISAYNLLYCIPQEVLGEDFNSKFPNFYSTRDINLKTYATIKSKYDTNKALFEELELAASLVLTVFIRLFIPNGPSSNNIYKERTLPYDGLLYDIYMRDNTYFCAYAILNDTLLAFSHGGLTRKFVDNAYKTKIDNYFDNDVNYKRLTDGLTKTGGYYRIVDDSTNTDVIIKCIEDYNRENKELLKKVVNDSLYSVTYSTPPTNWGWNFEKVRKGIHVKPTKGLVKLMAMTAGFDSCKHPTVGNCLFNENNVNTGEYSPIMPGIVDLRDEKMTLHCGDKKFVQFIGHVPQGFGASIDLFTKNGNDNSTYNINLDISNTGLTHDMVSNIDNLDKNFFYMAYSNNGKLTTHGKLHMNGSASSFKSITSDKSYVIEFDSEYDLLGADFKNHLIQKMISEEPKKPIFEHGKLVNNIFLYSIKSGYDYEAKTHTGGSRHKKRVTTRKNKLKNNKTKKNKRR